MKFLMLGSGTSTGVPRIGNDWGACDPTEPRNRRSRCSALIETDSGTRILIDTSPDLRSQLLANDIDRVDAVLWTHDHADHCHGIDDLRPMRYGRSNALPGYASVETVRRLRSRFGYVFAGKDGYSTIVQLAQLNRLHLVEGCLVRHCEMPHGAMTSTGYRFECGDKSVGYAVDYQEITSEMLDLFADVDILVCDCLRRQPHPTHAHAGMALDFAEQVRARHVVLTHMDNTLDYETFGRELPEHVLVGFDGLEVSL